MPKPGRDFFALSDECIAAIWRTAPVVLDTNVLLCLHRKSSAGQGLRRFMDSVSDRLWMPYQVMLEYFNTRLRKAPTLAAMHELLKAKVAEEGAATHSDRILDYVLTLYKDKVGGNFTPGELRQIYTDGRRRYARRIPPGYSDARLKMGGSFRSIYGDLILWKEMIRHARTGRTDIIFVTNDRKDDWWDTTAMTTVPRIELLREFHTKTKGRRLLMYRFDSLSYMI